MSMGKLESFLEKHIEGFFNRKLGSSVEQSEIMKQLERELLHRRKKGRTETVVPNSFYIELTEEDYQRLCVRRFLDDLYIQAEKLVIQNDCFMDEELSITVNSNSTLARGTCVVAAQFTSEVCPKVRFVERDSDQKSANRGFAGSVTGASLIAFAASSAAI